ncbi:RagB/SusD family nutrient uptake outer membrane protein [Mucilaginibacter sp. cycad4]|uniref:RagB/SusD family nutrient uptake outer membrane protein n=1 Tax=Mucilaginibacter sp. cycad4 TaxID=3342096 RepID=UPI002AAB7275|nr:RagB/SusD family nutrient uptake outer membrane protein [Mucilaginibacter gossypii]WPU99077.1 RagB/SusD family nutrient uptake outer membrane protein [Mucilaginibacter gossypii]
MKPLVYIKCTVVLSAFLTLLGSCKKEDNFLSTKPNQNLAVPSNLTDLVNLLNNETVFNRGADPALGEISSDDFNVADIIYPNLSLNLERNTYTWQKTLYDATFTQIPDWDNPYAIIYYSNIILEALPKIDISGQKGLADQVRGAALFYRGYSYYNLVQTFALPYDASNAGNIPGVPIRLNSDLNLRPKRSSLAECYKQIITDIQQAIPLLPVVPKVKTQPSQPAANALMARIELALGNYADALTYANACLSKNSALTNYNGLTTPSTTGLSKTYLDEDIYHSTLNNYSIFSRTFNYVPPAFIALYDVNDLRRTKFFTVLSNQTQYPRFVGSYDIRSLKYSGLATDEVYLIKAECLARTNDLTNAMSTLNTLLIKRWKPNTFIPVTAETQDEAIDKILLERRKELLFRGLRWTDLRRLNKDPKYAITLTRVIGNDTYTLPPNDPRYAMPIPDNEISLEGIIQNPR